MTNRLVDATSPYLLQHADNPVDWWEWEPAAFAEAARRDVPILLSVGFAACHWCHVMAHESFEDEQVAAALRKGFVAIKVDREERPDVDAVYMAATTALTGHGGWPMTAILTPAGDPFFCGTYFPKPQFLQLLATVSETWNTRRDDLCARGSHIASAIRASMGATGSAPVDEADLDQAVALLGSQFDSARGGFGGAPKFPPSMVLEFLLRHHANTGSAEALEMATSTLTAMARGGIYDQLGGGFSRYAVDAAWVVPHFEKMLYDNAQLARVYLHWWRATGDPLGARIALECADFIAEDLGTAEGGYASALDADTDGVEGLTYAWTPAQLEEVLGADDGRRAAELLAVTDAGTFEHGASTLQLRTDPVSAADISWWADTRRRLLEARSQRPQPARDDKVVTSWNGLAIAALAEVGVLLDSVRHLDSARQSAAYLVETHVVDGRLRRSSRGGTVGQAAGVLDDYGNLAEGLLTLHEATGEVRWLEAAGDLLETALAHFVDVGGQIHDTADDADPLFARPASAADNAEPSGVSALGGALLHYGALTGSSRHLMAADRAIGAGGAVAQRDPRFAGWTLAVAEARHTGPVQVAVVGSGPAADELVAVARQSGSPGLVLAAGPPDAPGMPLLADRPLVDGAPAAYVCRGFVCDRPVTAADDLRLALEQPPAG